MRMKATKGAEILKGDPLYLNAKGEVAIHPELARERARTRKLCLAVACERRREEKKRKARQSSKRG